MPNPLTCSVEELYVAAKTATGQEPDLILARDQPCGCIVCKCHDEEHCYGCGAKNCGTHKVGQIPNPVYEEPVFTPNLAFAEPPAPDWEAVAKEALRLLEACQDELSQYALCSDGCTCGDGWDFIVIR